MVYINISKQSARCMSANLPAVGYSAAGHLQTLVFIALSGPTKQPRRSPGAPDKSFKLGGTLWVYEMLRHGRAVASAAVCGSVTLSSLQFLHGCSWLLTIMPYWDAVA